MTVRRRDYPDDAGVWTLRRRWGEEKRRLQAELRWGRYRAQPLRRLERRGGERLRVWSARDALVLYERSADRTVMDDLAGRRCVRRLGLPLIGTLGLLLTAHLRGEVRSLKSGIERLHAAGFYASEALVGKVLRAAGE